MKPFLSRGAALFLGSLFAIMLGVLLYLQDTKPRGSLPITEGKIVNRTPITTQGKLTGFRICVGNEPQTFTYADPDPSVEHVWQVVNAATRAVVQYSDGVGKNPVLWGLEVNGEVLAIPAQLQEARTARHYIYAAGFVAAIGVFVVALFGSMAAGKRRISGAPA